MRGVAQRYLYQVINNTRQEILFGVTDLQLDKELERLSKDPKGPTAGWKHNDEVTFRSLTDPQSGVLRDAPLVVRLTSKIAATLAAGKSLG